MKLVPFALLALAMSPVAQAGPADYIYSPIVEYREREVDVKFGQASQLDGTSDFGGSIGFGYGAREHWFTEVYLKREREGGTSSTLAEWENKFQLTETGEYPVDAGFITELEAPLGGNGPWEIRLGPLLQTEVGRMQLNGNLLFTRAFGKADDNGIPYSTDFSYQWQAKYRWRPELEFGLQGLGDVGKWNDWASSSDQTHSIGPAIFGKFVLPDRRAIRYNAAWLAGASQATPNHTFRLQVEYEF